MKPTAPGKGPCILSETMVERGALRSQLQLFMLLVAIHGVHFSQHCKLMKSSCIPRNGSLHAIDIEALAGRQPSREITAAQAIRLANKCD